MSTSPGGPPIAQPAESRGPSPVQLLTGAILMAFGFIWLLEAADLADVPWFAVFSMLLMLVGAALVIGSRTDERGGLITLGVILTLILTVAAWTDLRLEGGLGDLVVEPATIEDLDDRYVLSAGTLTLDFRRIAPMPQGETAIEGRVGAGELIVLVPGDLAVAVDWQMGAGEIDVFDREQSGLLLEDGYMTPGYRDAERQLRLDLSVGTGTIEVRS